MPGAVELQAFRRNVLPDGRKVTKEDRERLLQPFLPPAPSSAQPAKSSTRTGRSRAARFSRPHLRPLVSGALHYLIFHAIQLLFGLYIVIRQTYHVILYRLFSILYYHHRTPELIRRDVRNLSRLPKHLSILLELESDGNARNDSEALTKLINDVAEIACWCACVGIPMLSVYERTGVLKQRIPTLHRSVKRVLQSYFPPSSSESPLLHIRAPHHAAYSPPSSPPPEELVDDATEGSQKRPVLNILPLSASDGRDTLVDLTKTLAEMAQRGRIKPADVTADLIDAELTSSSCGEPDLLVLMTSSSRSSAAASGKALQADQQQHTRAGGGMCLQGYPPWQVRLTEIFELQDSTGVDYQVFLRALHRYGKAELRFGR